MDKLTSRWGRALAQLFHRQAWGLRSATYAVGITLGLLCSPLHLAGAAAASAPQPWYQRVVEGAIAEQWAAHSTYFPDTFRVDVAVHRGLRSSYHGRVPDEDSVRACLSAVTAGAEACEIDVRTSADGVALLMHDSTTARTTRGIGCTLRVAATSYRRLSRCRLLHGDSIPRLADVARAMRPYARKHSLIVELKASSFARAGLLHINHDLARSGFTGARGNLVYESFSRRNLVRMKRVSPQAPLLLISLHAPGAVAVAGSAGLSGLILPYAALVRAHRRNPTYVEEFRDRAMQVMPWQVNSPGRLHRALATGVTGLLTDNEVTLRAALRLRR